MPTTKPKSANDLDKRLQIPFALHDIKPTPNQSHATLPKLNTIIVLKL